MSITYIQENGLYKKIDYKYPKTIELFIDNQNMIINEGRIVALIDNVKCICQIHVLETDDNIELYLTYKNNIYKIIVGSKPFAITILFLYLYTGMDFIESITYKSNNELSCFIESKLMVAKQNLDKKYLDVIKSFEFKAFIHSIMDHNNDVDSFINAGFTDIDKVKNMDINDVYKIYPYDDDKRKELEEYIRINGNPIISNNQLDKKITRLEDKVDSMEEKLDELLSILKFGPLSQIALDAKEDFDNMLKDNNK